VWPLDAIAELITTALQPVGACLAGTAGQQVKPPSAAWDLVGCGVDHPRRLAGRAACDGRLMLGLKFVLTVIDGRSYGRQTTKRSSI
jgi:hypothetical protein